MKRYLVFAGDTYYPNGGWDDIYGAYETSDEAVAAADEAHDQYDWVQVIDIETASLYIED